MRVLVLGDHDAAGGCGGGLLTHMRKANVAKAEHAHRCRRLRVPWARSSPGSPAAETMVSNTIQCGFESHPGRFSLHSKGSGLSVLERDPVPVHPRPVRMRAIEAPRSRLVAERHQQASRRQSVRAEGVARSRRRTARQTGAVFRLHGGHLLRGVWVCAALGFYLGDGCISQQLRTFSLRVSCDAGYPPSSTRCPGRSGPSTSQAGSVMSEAQGSSSSRTAGTTGRACSRSTVRAASTSSS